METKVDRMVSGSNEHHLYLHSCPHEEEKVDQHVFSGYGIV